MSRDYYMQTALGDVFVTQNPEWHADCTALSRADGSRIYRAQMIAGLKKTLKPRGTVYTSLRAVSRSGMSRRLRVYIVSKDKRITDITYTAATLTGNSLRDGDLVIGGCGMDMGFAVVYALGQALWPRGTPKPHGTRDSQPDRDGGYALKHEWI